MVDESDGIEEALEGQIRVLISAAGQVGERIARVREEALRRAETASEQEARELRSRLEAEQRAARAELGNVHRSDWWDRADAEQIGHAFQVARAWAQEDPEAVRAEQRMRDELRTRYGVDVDDTGADPDAVRAALERAENERARSDVERNRAAAEEAEAQQLMNVADAEDQRAAEARAAAKHEPDPDERTRAAAAAEHSEAKAAEARADGRAAYDSAERRDATAHDLEGKGIDHEVVATRMRADVSQAKPAAEAVAGGTQRSKAPKARRTRGRGAQSQRTGLVR